MTKTYNDIDAVTRLLEEVSRGNGRIDHSSHLKIKNRVEVFFGVKRGLHVVM